MATKIEVLAISHKEVTLALYYPIANVIPAAIDANRTAAGGGLSPGELQALKNGQAHELIKKISIAGLSNLEAKTKIEASWEKHAAEARQDYRKKYRDKSYVGKTWNGTASG